MRRSGRSWRGSLEIEDRSQGAVIRRAVDQLDAPPAEPENWELSGWDYGEGGRR